LHEAGSEQLHVLGGEGERAADHRGMVTDEPEIAPLEEHLLACSLCVERAEESQGRVDAIRAAIIEGGFDLE
jgi:hypothetical protein